jgi:hypothetical protein
MFKKYSFYLYAIIFLFAASNGIAQTDDDVTIRLTTYGPVNDLDFLLSDPALSKMRFNQGPGTSNLYDMTEQSSPSGGAGGGPPSTELVFGMQTQVSNDMISYSVPVGLDIPIPFGESMRNTLSLSATVPLILQRKLDYTNKEAITRGLGDLILSSGLTMPWYDNAYKTRLFFSTKLNTGDKNANDEGYLVPLGTGSIDYYLSFSAEALDWGIFYAGMHAYYRIGGETERIYESLNTATSSTKITEENTLNGDLWGAAITMSLTIGDLRVYATPSFLHTENGEIERIELLNGAIVGTSAAINPTKNDIFDVNLGAGLPLNFEWFVLRGTSLHGSAKIPVNNRSKFEAFFNINFHFIAF